MYKEYIYNKDFVYDTGWDKYAEDYSKLLIAGTVYELTKMVAHSTLLKFTGKKKQITVLDLNCGTGNDFPFFIEQGWNIIGCDGSAGMLNKACEKYAEQIENGQIKLYQGMMENLNPSSFGDIDFDLIYSITGGYTYITDQEFVKVNDVLSHYLKDGGLMFTAHLNKFCLAETAYYLLKGKFKSAFIRLKKDLVVPIKNESFRMYLRNCSMLKKLKSHNLKLMKIIPLLVVTPPYQTGFSLPRFIFNSTFRVEKFCSCLGILTMFSDQVIAIYKKTNS